MAIIKLIPAFQTWPLRHAVMWPDEPFDFIRLERDETDGKHYGLFIGDQLVSVVSVFAEHEDSLQFRKFATSLAMQGKGYGTQLLAHIIELAQEQGYNSIWCNARLEKSIYYERFGLRKTAITFEKRGVEFVVMKLEFS